MAAHRTVSAFQRQLIGHTNYFTYELFARGACRRLPALPDGGPVCHHRALRDGFNQRQATAAMDRDAIEHLRIDGRRLEVRRIAGEAARPPLVFLHEGLGSVALWRDFPDQVARATRCPAIVYSRYGYGRSDPIDGPRTPDYMHHEAQVVLPQLLAALDIAAPVLIGHSDGGSIALIFAGEGRWPVRGVVTAAAHVFVEDISVASIAAAREAWAETDLRARLARYHADVDGAFAGWNDAWLDPAFRDWNIEDCLGVVTCPVLAIQGTDDEYGTMAQLDAIAAQVAGPCETLRLAQCGHSAHRDQRDATCEAIVRFIASTIS